MAGVAALGAFEPFFDAIFVPVIRYLEAFLNLLRLSIPWRLIIPACFQAVEAKTLDPALRSDSTAFSVKAFPIPYP